MFQERTCQEYTLRTQKTNLFILLISSKETAHVLMDKTPFTPHLKKSNVFFHTTTAAYFREPIYSKVITIENDCEQQIQQHVLREAFVITRHEAIFIFVF